MYRRGPVECKYPRCIALLGNFDGTTRCLNDLRSATMQSEPLVLPHLITYAAAENADSDEECYGAYHDQSYFHLPNNKNYKNN